MDRPLTLAEHAAAARSVLSDGAWAYYAGGAGDELTLQGNETSWARWALRPRVLVDVSAVDPGVTVLGERWAHPVAVAPMAHQVGVHPSGEAGLCAAAAAVGATYCLSTSASTTPAALAQAVPHSRRWFQLYVRDGVDGARRQIAEAVDGGCSAVLLTVDLPVVGVRDRERQFPWAPSPAVSTIAASGQVPLAALTWRDLEVLVRTSPVPLLVKGVLDPRDARLAVDAGAAGVVVSNHGGRQLDRVLPTCVVLPEVVAEVGHEVDVLVDGGVRRGVDVVTALSLGATAVLVGRPLLWGLAVDGQAGAEHVLRLLLEEVETSLALLGVPRAQDLSPDCVRPT